MEKDKYSLKCAHCTNFFSNKFTLKTINFSKQHSSDISHHNLCKSSLLLIRNSSFLHGLPIRRNYVISTYSVHDCSHRLLRTLTESMYNIPLSRGPQVTNLTCQALNQVVDAIMHIYSITANVAS